MNKNIESIAGTEAIEQRVALVSKLGQWGKVKAKVKYGYESIEVDFGKQMLKLGLDLHYRQVTGGMQEDGGLGRPAGKMGYERSFCWQPALRKRIEALAPKSLPKGIGRYSWAVLEYEMKGWGRFSNRRQVSSYTGLCPGVHQSDQRAKEGCINRCGNRVVRWILIEMVWRLMRWQRHYMYFPRKTGHGKRLGLLTHFGLLCKQKVSSFAC